MVFLGSSIVIAHQHSNGAANEQETTIGKSVAKLSLTDYMMADKGCDRDPLRIQIRDQGAVPVIPTKQNSTTGNGEMDCCIYRYRHLIQYPLARLKHFRAITTRYDKQKRNFESVIALTYTFLWLPI